MPEPEQEPHGSEMGSGVGLVDVQPSSGGWGGSWERQKAPRDGVLTGEGGEEKG